jgi:simple sugar transport system substrate-binding protein
MQGIRRMAAFGIALALHGCGGGADPEAPGGIALPASAPAPAREARAERALVVGFANVESESTWLAAVTRSICEEAERRGIELVLSGARGGVDREIQALRGFIARRVDAVLLVPERPLGFGPVLKELRAARIPVVLVGSRVDAEPDSYATLIGSDYVHEGRMAAQWLIAHVPGNVRLAEIQGTSGSAPATDRQKGFEEVLVKEPRFQVLHSPSGHFEKPRGKEVMEAFLRGWSNRIDAVFAHNDDMALGAIQAIETAGLKPGKDVVLVSIDATRGAIEAIRSGKLGAAIESNPLLGPLAFDAIEALARGERPDRRIVIPNRLIDATNVEVELPNRRY